MQVKSSFDFQCHMAAVLYTVQGMGYVQLPWRSNENQLRGMKGNHSLIIISSLVVARHVVVGFPGFRVGNGSHLEVRNVSGQGKQLLSPVSHTDIGYFQCIHG